MKQVIATVFLLMAVSAASATSAGNCRQRNVVLSTAHSATISQGLMVVPFAVPVAVPVATISRPTLFYGYSNYSRYTASESQSAASGGTRSTNEDAGESPRNATLKADSILSRNCSACHTGQAAQGGLQIFHAGGRIFEKLPRHVILEMVSPDASGVQKMPPGDRPKLTPAEQEILRDWARLPRNAVY